MPPPAAGQPNPRMPISMRRDPGGHQATCHADPPTGPEPAQLPSSTTHRHSPPLPVDRRGQTITPAIEGALCSRTTSPINTAWPTPARRRERGAAAPIATRHPVAPRCTHRICRQRGTSSRHVATDASSRYPTQEPNRDTGGTGLLVGSGVIANTARPTTIARKPPPQSERHTTFPRTYAARPRSRTGRLQRPLQVGRRRAGLALARSRLRAPCPYAQRPKWPTKTHSALVTHATTVRPAAPRRAPHQSRTKRPSIPGARHLLAGAHSPASHCPRVHWLVEPEMPKSPRRHSERRRRRGYFTCHDRRVFGLGKECLPTPLDSQIERADAASGGPMIGVKSDPQSSGLTPPSRAAEGMRCASPELTLAPLGATSLTQFTAVNCIPVSALLQVRRYSARWSPRASPHLSPSGHLDGRCSLPR